MMYLNKTLSSQKQMYPFLIGVLLCAYIPTFAQADYYVNANTSCTSGCNGTTWAKAFDNLQSALDIAIEGNEIWVAKGTYYPSKDKSGNSAPTNNRKKTFYFNTNLTIYGGFPNTGNPTMTERDWETHKTILSGDLDKNDADGLTEIELKDHASRQDNACTVFHSNYLSNSFLIDGFWIEDGNANLSGSRPNDSGGGMLNHKSNPTVSNCNFSKNSTGRNGGGIFNYINSHIVLSNCSFFNNFARWGGGLYNQRSQPIISDCSFSDNSAGGNGGGMFNFYEGNPIVNNCTFSNNSAIYGGAMYNSNNNSSLSNCTFTENSASVDGGAIHNFLKSPMIADCTFTSNTATDDGGAISNERSKPTITNCVFTNNSADDKAGALFNTLDSHAIITGCSFSENSANYGGGVYNYLSNPDFSNATFTENSAIIDGGGIYNNGKAPTIADCTFTNNTATDDGGAIANENSQPTITDCVFTNNSADDNAGALFNISGSRAIISDCSFSENSAKNGGALYNNAYFNMTACTFSANSSIDYGGGIYNHNGVPEITDCSFFGNTTKRGGGLHNVSGSPILKNCIFSENPASIDGGGIHSFGGAPNIINCYFSDNTARWGGGVYNAYGTPTLTACTFSKNRVTRSGGGMFNRDGGKSKITNSGFFKNSARWGGGIFSRTNCSPTITNCTFSENSASVNGDGIHSSENTHTTLNNCILWNNGLEITKSTDSYTTVNHSIVEGNYDGISNLDEDPMFIDPANDNFRLSCLSPAIDMGDNAADLDGAESGIQTIADLLTDLAENKRIVNNTIDMGAYEGAVGILGTFDFCRGRKAVLDAGTWSTYSWSNGITDQSIESDIAGIYTVTVTNEEGCSSTASTEITAIPCLAEAGTLMTNAETICAGDAIEVSTSDEQSDPNYLQYFFLYTQDNLDNTLLYESNLAVYESGKASVSFEGMTAGNYLVCAYNEYQECLPTPSPITAANPLNNLYQTGTSQDGCFDIECVEITVPEAFQPAENSGQVTGTDALGHTIFMVEVCGGTFPYSMDYDFEQGFMNVQEYPSQNTGCLNYQVIYTPGTEWVLALTDAHNCSNESVVFSSDDLPDMPFPQIVDYTSSPETCPGDFDGAIDLIVQGGDAACGDYTYTWSSTNGFAATITGAPTAHTLNDLTTGHYHVTVTDCAGTSTVDEIYVSRTNNTPSGRARGRGGCKTGGDLDDGIYLWVSPNPFKEQTSIEFSLTQNAKVWLNIYSIDGRKVAELLKGESMEANKLQQVDFEGGLLLNGVYILELQTDTGERSHQKLIIQR